MTICKSLLTRKGNMLQNRWPTGWLFKEVREDLSTARSVSTSSCCYGAPVMTFQFPYAQHQGPEAGCFKNLSTSWLRYQGGHFPKELGIVQLSYQLPNCQNVIRVNLLRWLRNTLLHNHCLFDIKKYGALSRHVTSCSNFARSNNLHKADVGWGSRFQVLQIFITALDFTVSYTFLHTLHKLGTDTNIFHVHNNWNYLNTHTYMTSNTKVLSRHIFSTQPLFQSGL